MFSISILYFLLFVGSSGFAVIPTPSTSTFGCSQNTVLSPVPEKSLISSQIPLALYDEQLGITFTQNFTSMAYNVTAVAQNDSYGYGPAYLLNGLSNSGYWYQVGLSYDWPYAYPTGGGYNRGFNMNYEVFNASGDSVFPSNGWGGLLPFLGQVNSGDSVLLRLYFSNSDVTMYAKDWNTGAIANMTYTDEGANYFMGSPNSAIDNNGFFTGLMTEWYHVNPYYGNEAKVTYSNYGTALSSAWMWMDEFKLNQSNSKQRTNVWEDFAPFPVLYGFNPKRLQSFPSYGATEYSDAYEFVTGYAGPYLVFAQLRVTDYLGIPISGAWVAFTLDNGTSIQAATSSNGTISLGMISIGTFHATISYLGTTTTVVGDVSTQTLTTVRIFPSLPTFLIIVGVGIIIIIINVVIAVIRVNRHNQQLVEAFPALPFFWFRVVPNGMILVLVQGCY